MIYLIERISTVLRVNDCQRHYMFIKRLSKVHNKMLIDILGLDHEAVDGDVDIFFISLTFNRKCAHAGKIIN